MNNNILVIVLIVSQIKIKDVEDDKITTLKIQ